MFTIIFFVYHGRFLNFYFNRTSHEMHFVYIIFIVEEKRRSNLLERLGIY